MNQLQTLNEFDLSNAKECNPFENWTKEEIDKYHKKWQEFDREQRYKAGMSAISASKIILTD